MPTGPSSPPQWFVTRNSVGKNIADGDLTPIRQFGRIITNVECIHQYDPHNPAGSDSALDMQSGSRPGFSLGQQGDIYRADGPNGVNMPTKTKKRPRKTARLGTNKKSSGGFLVPCEFGGVSIGENTARLGIRMSRSDCSLDRADETFCGHRLTGEVKLSRNGDADGQMALVDDLEHTVRASFDVKRIGLTPDAISTGLTFSLADIDVAELAKFSKGKGTLLVESVAELPDEEEEQEAEDGEGE